MSARPLISDLHSAPCSLLLAPCSLEEPAIRRAGEAEPSNAPHKLRPVACRARRGLVGDRKCVAHPAQPTFRCSGDRVLGTRPDSAHAVAAFAFKARGLTKNRRPHLGLS